MNIRVSKSQTAEGVWLFKVNIFENNVQVFQVTAVLQNNKIKYFGVMQGYLEVHMIPHIEAAIRKCYSEVPLPDISLLSISQLQELGATILALIRVKKHENAPPGVIPVSSLKTRQGDSLSQAMNASVFSTRNLRKNENAKPAMSPSIKFTEKK